MKKLLVVSCVFLLFTGCSSSEPATEPVEQEQVVVESNTTEDAVVTEEVAAVDEKPTVKTGIIKENNYINEYYGIELEATNDWSFLASVADYDETTPIEFPIMLIKNNGQLTQNSLSLIVEELPESLDVDMYASSAFPTYEKLYGNGYAAVENVKVEKNIEKITVSGKTGQKMSLQAKADDINIYQNFYLLPLENNQVLTIFCFSIDETLNEEVQAIAESVVVK